jgi:hypothetical protein
MLGSWGPAGLVTARNPGAVIASKLRREQGRLAERPALCEALADLVGGVGCGWPGVWGWG